MIKSGGNRISPKEVEEVIQEIDGVQEVAVVGVYDDLLGETIKAFVVPIKDAPIDIKAVQLHCRKNLAIYKIPKSVEFIESLPKTASGKVQRFLL
jgi:acyl-CoA synthetase (AMP-forming)/AMP-acid ligase II